MEMKKVIVNTCFGGFNFNNECGFKKHDRENPAAIAYLEQVGSNKASGHFARLGIAEFPAAATDWELSEYDGIEHVIYVLDGKLFHAMGKCVSAHN